MRDNKLVGVSACLITLGSLGVIAFSLNGGCGPRVNSALYQEVGRALARQALSLVKPNGRITVITRDTATFQNPASDLQLAGFRAELAKGGSRIDSIQTLQVDPLRPIAVPAGDFFQWIRTSTNGNVIVSFMGPPLLTDAQLSQLGEIKPAIVAFCPGAVRDQSDLRSLFSRGLVQAAVVSKRALATGPAKAGTARELFNLHFAEVTAANLASLSTNTIP